MQKIILIVILVAIVAIAVTLLLGPVINAATDKINRDGDLGDVAATAAAGVVDLQLTKMAYTPTLAPTATPGQPPLSAAEVAATAMAYQAQLQATQDAQAARTQVAYQATQDARMYQATATAEYWKAAERNATQTQAAAVWATDAARTEVAYAWTQTAIPFQATADAYQVYAQQTVVAGQAQQVALAVRRQQWAGPGTTVVTWIVLTGAVAIVGFYAYQMARVRKLTPDGRVHLLDNGRSGQFVVASELMTAPVAAVRAGQVQMAGAGPDQERVNERAQKVRAVEAMARAVQPPRNPLEAVAEIMGGQSPRYQVSEPPADLLDEHARRALDADWEAER